MPSIDTYPASYCANRYAYERFITREVTIGELGMGAHHPIRVQSMTTTDTMDTQATVAQSIRMIEAGCELVRITAPSLKEAENLRNIRDALRKQGFKTPLVADIHFTPNAAELAARIVEKVRINPGNYADKKKFEVIDYSDAAYAAELERIHERFVPLVRICKEYGTAMRIGTNHGSLSDRIMSRYGDSPLGMVESAMEFLRIAEGENFHNIVLSMKSSNPLVMVQAYRLLVKHMQAEGMNYPLHLGVTEAGEGEDGRIKSAAGIGTLLEDGLGDTIRVSLTEEPEFEIPVAKALAERYSRRGNEAVVHQPERIVINFFQQEKRKTQACLNIGGENVPIVVADFSDFKLESPAHLFRVGYQYSVPLDKWNMSDMACDYLFVGKQLIAFETPGTLGIIQQAEAWQMDKAHHYPLFDHLAAYLQSAKRSKSMNWVLVSADDTSWQTHTDLLKSDNSLVLVLYSKHPHAMVAIRALLESWMALDIKRPVIIQRSFPALSENKFQLYAATDMGALLIDGLGDGFWMSQTTDQPHARINQTLFGILQACRARISKTEYISCPSCGRTLFDLQETTARIRSRTHHLRGLKIGIMGCIVNGPGEMADADFGYVGTGIGKITLYKGKEIVKRNVDAENAVDELIQLIKDHGRWVDAPEM